MCSLSIGLTFWILAGTLAGLLCALARVPILDRFGKLIFAAGLLFTSIFIIITVNVC